MQPDLHIIAPELLSRPERARDTVFTAVMWALYLYLWVPMISLFAWLLGLEFAYDVMIRSGGVGQLADAAWLYLSILLVILMVVTVWSLHNRLSYGHLSRRREMEPVSTKAMADYFRIDASLVEALRDADVASIDFDDDGQPVMIRSCIATTAPA